MSASWCHVKFAFDNSTVNMPTSFIEDIVDKKLDPSQLKVNDFYWVFWSPAVNETPLSLMKKGNNIVHVDDLSEKESERRKKSSGGPLKGYYKAMLLDLQSSEDSFQDVSKVDTLSSKRVVIPSDKVLQSKITAGTSGRGSAVKSAHGVKPSKRQVELAAQDASKKNSEDLLKMCGSSVQDKTSTESEDSTDSEEGIIDNNSVEFWKKKFEKLSAKKSNKSKKSKKKGKSSEKIESQHKLVKTFKAEGKAAAVEFKAPLDSMKIDDKGSSNPGALVDPSDSFGQEKIEADQKAKLPNEGKADGKTPVSKKALADSDENDPSEDDEDSFVVIKKRRTKPGAAGDFLFVMNEALKKWGHEAVAIRSPTGTAQPRKGSEAADGYPKMTPEKVSDIADKLKKRIQAEKAGKEELKARTAKLQYYLGQRVSSSRRSLRAKGIKIPSPKEVHAVEQQDPTSDGTAAYATRPSDDRQSAGVDDSDTDVVEDDNES